MTRTNFTDLTGEQLRILAAGFNHLWETGRIEDNANLHDINFRNGIHWGSAFLPWHRDFLRKLELALQEFDASISLPYWDWTREDSRDLDVNPWEEFFGGRDNDGGKFDFWTYNRNNEVALDPNTGELWKLPSLDSVIAELEADSYLNFRRLEAYPGSHVPGHTWTGGSMASGRSPIDPLFYLHHCNIDRLWAIWQLNNPDKVQYESTGVLPSDTVPQARVPIDQPMVEGEKDADGVTPASVLDHVALGYTYQRDERLEEAWFDKNGTELITNTAELDG